MTASVSNLPQPLRPRTHFKKEDVCRRIIFFSDYKLKEDLTKERCSCVQQYDVTSRTWLPCQVMPVMKLADFNICEDGEHIHLIGGEVGKIAGNFKYDILMNRVEFLGFTNFNTRAGSNLVAYRKKLYITGGKIPQGRSRSVFYTTAENDWSEATDMKFPRSFHVVLSTRKCIYALGGTRQNKLVIEYNSFCIGANTQWVEMPSPTPSPTLQPPNFFVIKNKLCCLYSKDDQTVQAMYNHSTNAWVYNWYAHPGYVIERVCQFSYVYWDTPGIFLRSRKVGTISFTEYTPNYVFGKSESYRHVRRQESKIRREIAFEDVTSVVYTCRRNLHKLPSQEVSVVK